MNKVSMRLRRRVMELAGDSFEGRAACSPGGHGASLWVAKEMSSIGLQGAAQDGGWFQPVPMMSVTTDYDACTIRLRIDDELVSLDADNGFLFRVGLNTSILDAEYDLVFAGYGINEIDGRNDYDALDIIGKVVVVLAGEPRFHCKDHPGQRASSYYGRWTYKYQEAFQRGAAGVILVHDELWSGYSFDTVRAAFASPPHFLRGGEGKRLALEAWCSQACARQLFKRAGVDWTAMIEAADQRSHAKVSLAKLRICAHLRSSALPQDCRNVIGRLAGAAGEDEHLVLMAHWDHLGTRVDLDGRRLVFNGAVDNASGVAMLLALAERFQGGPTPRRSVIFLSVTGEELGLLGSEWFATYPPVPSRSIVAGFNIDGYLPGGFSRDIVALGCSKSDLGRHIEEVAAKFGRYITDDINPLVGLYYRSDQINLALAGIPSVQISSGQDMMVGGVVDGVSKYSAYTDTRYHTPEDKFDPTWDFDGMAEDVEVLYNIVFELAQSDWWPSWQTPEFRRP